VGSLLVLSIIEGLTNNTDGDDRISVKKGADPFFLMMDGIFNGRWPLFLLQMTEEIFNGR